MMPINYIRNYYGVFMKIKLLCDPYPSWEGLEGKIIHAFKEKDTNRVYASIEEANSLGAKDAGHYNRHNGYRLLLGHEFEVVEK